MFIVRNATQNDLEDIYELSGKVNFINLPHDKEAIKKKIEASLKSFISPSADLAKNYYMFVLVDLSKDKVIGASMIHAKHGTAEEPHFYLKVAQENKFSTTINTGFVHGTLKLGLETNGYSEIGGLILDPSYRGHQDKLGKQISFVRFLYMGQNQDRFTKKIHSELMPPFDREGKSPLWEALGRQFLNMDYIEADTLSRSNKEFILSLFPAENIYMTLLPIEARDSIGKVGKDTEPVKKMLEDIGFIYMNEVDPFDGGPHYRAELKEIKPIKEMKTYKVEFSNESFKDKFLLSSKHQDYSFYALLSEGEAKGHILKLEKETEKYLSSSEVCGFKI